MALGDRDLLGAAIFVTACRHLANVNASTAESDTWMLLAAQYKAASIRNVRAAITAPGAVITDTTIAKVLALALDDVSMETQTLNLKNFANIARKQIITNTASSKDHVRAALKMAELRGGKGKLGLNGLLDGLLAPFAHYEDMSDSPFFPPSQPYCGPQFFLPARYG
jgi:hypothetical protein